MSDSLDKKQPFHFDYDTTSRSCMICKETYHAYNDPFMIVVDAATFVEITYELCLKCIRSFNKCNNCKRELEEPWDLVYFICDNPNSYTYLCACCYNDTRNKQYKKCGVLYCNHCQSSAAEKNIKML